MNSYEKLKYKKDLRELMHHLLNNGTEIDLTATSDHIVRALYDSYPQSFRGVPFKDLELCVVEWKMLKTLKVTTKRDT